MCIRDRPGAGRIIGIGDKGNTGPVVDQRAHGGEIMTVRHLVIGRIGLGDTRSGTDGLSDDGIHGECVFGKNSFVFWRQKRPRYQFQYVIGTVAERQRRHRYAKSR